MYYRGTDTLQYDQSSK